MTSNEFLSRLEGVRPQGDGFVARSAHNDGNPSLSVAEGADGRILINCFAGCSFKEITCALGISSHDLFPKNGCGASHGVQSVNNNWGALNALVRSRASLELLIERVAHGDFWRLHRYDQSTR